MNEDKSSRYHRLKRRSAVASVAVTAVLLAGLLVSGGSAVLRDASMAIADGRAGSHWTVTLYAALLAVLHEALAFPLALYNGFVLDRRYGLSSASRGLWMRDHVKASALRVVIAVGGATTMFLFMRLFPRWWWLAGAAVVMGVIAATAQLLPVLILPWFYRVTPLGRESLRARLAALSERAGVPVLGIYEWGVGERSRVANAALVGAGGTRRILVSDTMLAEYSEDEVEVVLAHELAHHVHRDMAKSLALEFLFVLLAFASAAMVLTIFGPGLKLGGPADVAVLPLLLLAAGAVFVVLTPLANALSRANERRADRFALTLTGQAGAFVSAMRRLAAQNLAEAHPSRLTLWLFHTHPPVEQRIEFARAWQPRIGPP